MTKVLTAVFWALAAALVISDIARVSLLYFKPRDLLSMYVDRPSTNYRLLAVDDYRTLRGGQLSWTFAVQANHEKALAAKCKRPAGVDRIGAYFKITAIPLAPGEVAPPIVPEKPKLGDASGCLLAEWSDAKRSSGGIAVLSGNLVQISIWYD